MAVEVMTLEDKIEVAAAAMYQSRNLRTWKTLQYRRPDIAQIYRENARVMIGAIEEAEAQHDLSGNDRLPETTLSPA